MDQQQIAALYNYLKNSSKNFKQALTPSQVTTGQMIADMALPLPTLNDFRTNEMYTDYDSKLFPYRGQVSDTPIQRKRFSRLPSDPDAELNHPLVRREKVDWDNLKEYEPVYETHQPILYTPGFENYMAPWINWADAWGETYTPQ